MFTGKIHRCTVTHADLHYEGSVTIDADLLDASGILVHEEVQIWNITRGSRIATYTIAGPRGSGVICINGAAAHHFQPGDLAIIAAFAEMDDDEARCYQPKVVLVDAENQIKELREEVPGPQMPARMSDDRSFPIR